MEDPKVPFADTTERRAQLMAATERFKSSIDNGLQNLKGDAGEIGKTTAFVGGVALAVFLLANAILPKSDEYRYAEKYGERDEEDNHEDDDDDDEDLDDYEGALADDAPTSKRKQAKVVKKQAKESRKQAAAGGLIGGLLTSVITSLAREQLNGFLARMRENNASKPAPQPVQTGYYQQPTPQSAGYADAPATNG